MPVYNAEGEHVSPKMLAHLSIPVENSPLYRSKIPHP